MQGGALPPILCIVLECDLKTTYCSRYVLFMVFLFDGAVPPRRSGSLDDLHTIFNLNHHSGSDQGKVIY